MSPSPKRLVLEQITHHETPYVPYTLSFEGDVPERLDAYYGGTHWRDLLDNAIRHVPVPNLVVDAQEAKSRVADPYGATWQTNRRPFHLLEAPLKDASLEGYIFPDLDAYYTPDWKREALEALAQDPEHFYVAGFGFGLFERTWVLRGFEEALADAAGDPGFYDELVERVTEHQLQILDRLLELPVHGIMFSDDWGYQHGVLLGPERWRRFIKPRLARMYARVHEAGKYTLSHCCGSVVDIMPDIIEIGLDVLESVQPEARGMDPYTLKRTFGDRITFWGGLGSQSTIPFGTPAEIKAEINRLCREMGRGGGYILAPAKGLQPETPTENAVAVVEGFLAQSGVHLS
ncbi:MAG: hypothetical protein FJZ90_11400 [Chloroflexi bacterium]|nr:hypothetical protein [Chloroflexota bacterium]